MNVKALIADINRTKNLIENELEENGGELTADLQAQGASLEAMKELLGGEGVDDLGRWLKGVQDELATAKAEASMAARRVKSLRNYEEYVKSLVGEAMDALDLRTNDKGEKVAKGSFYGFKRTTSTRATVCDDRLQEMFVPKLESLMARGKFPAWLRVKVSATATDIREAGGDALAFLEENTAPALYFTKPRWTEEKKAANFSDFDI